MLRAHARRATMAWCVAAISTLPAKAHALDADVRADTYAQAYQLRGPAGAPIISSQRVTQTLSLDAVERSNDPRGIVVSLRVRLRFDADFGEACDAATDRCLDETNRARSAEFQPLFTPRSMDLPYAYVDVANIGRGVLDVRAGRIFQVDPLGFFLFDGARARLHALGLFVVEMLGGLETRAGFPASNGRFERDGLIRADRAEWDASLAPYVLHEEPAPVLGVSIETATTFPLYARASYRRVWTSTGVSEEKIGAEVDASVGRHLRLFGNAVYSIPQQTFANVFTTAEWFDGHGARVALEYARYRPTFDLSSIWPSFWSDGTDEARLRGALPLRGRLVLTAAGYVRRYALSETGPSPGETQQGDLWNTGAEGAISMSRAAWRTTLRGHAEGGAVGPRGGADLDGFWWALPDVLRVEARLSLWHVEDELRPLQSGFFFGGVVGATVRLGSLANLHVDVEDDVNHLVGQRFRAMAILAVRGLL